jgi:hypothetical protein
VVDTRPGTGLAQAGFLPGPPGEDPRANRAHRGGSLVARVTWEGSRRTLVVHRIHSERTVRALSRAVASWDAFGRYDRILLDLTRLRHPSAELAATLASDARRVRGAGRRLGFVPPPDAAAEAGRPGGAGGPVAATDYALR